MNHRSPGEFRIALAVLLLLALLISPACAWWDVDYTKRKEITITNPPPSANFQVFLNVSYDSDMQADFDDLRFIDGDDSTVLDYWIERKTDSSFASVWIELADTGTDAYMYYGKGDAPTGSNITNTFIFADDFNDGTIAAKWTAMAGTGVVTEGSGYLRTDATGTWQHSRLRTTNTLDTDNTIIELKLDPVAESKQPSNIYYSTSDITGTVYWQIYRTSADKLQVYTRQGGTTDARELGTYSLSIGTWYKLRVIDTGTAIQYKLYSSTDGLLETSSVINYDTTTQYLAMGSASSTDETYWDDFRQRKYNATEPALSLGEEEDPSNPPLAIPTYTFPIENWNATRVAGGFSTLVTVTIPLLLETVAANIVMLIIVLGTMLTIKLFLRW